VGDLEIDLEARPVSSNERDESGWEPLTNLCHVWHVFVRFGLLRSRLRFRRRFDRNDRDLINRWVIDEASRVTALQGFPENLPREQRFYLEPDLPFELTRHHVQDVCRYRMPTAPHHPRLSAFRTH
jgi:hypothetical protein